MNNTLPISPLQAGWCHLFSLGGTAARLACSATIETVDDGAAFLARLRRFAARHDAFSLALELDGATMRQTGEPCVEWLAAGDEAAYLNLAEAARDAHPHAPIRVVHWYAPDTRTLRLTVSASPLLLDVPTVRTWLDSGWQDAAAHAPALGLLDVIEWMHGEQAFAPPDNRTFWAAQTRGFQAAAALFGQAGQPGAVAARRAFELDADSAARFGAAAAALGGDSRQLLLALWGYLQCQLQADGAMTVYRHQPGRGAADLADVVGAMDGYVPQLFQAGDAASWRDLMLQAAAPEPALDERQMFMPWADVVDMTCGFRYLPASDVRLAAGALAVDWRGTGFSMELMAEEAGGGLRLHLLVAGRSQGDAEAAWLQQRLQTLIASCIADVPLATCAGASITPVLHGPAAPAPFGDVVSCLRHWARHTPGAQALADGVTRYSYAELDNLTERVALQLQRHGVQAGDRVLLEMEGGCAQLLAALAVMKAGAAYVPLDPAYPAQRKQDIARCAAAVLTIAADDGAAAGAPARRTWQDLEQAARHGATHASLPAPASSAEAYVIFTSGSTGEPKGVAISHGAICHYGAAVSGALAPHAPATYASLSTVVADLGYTAVYGSLASGQCLRLFPEAAKLDAALLAAHMAQYPVDCLKIVPSHLALLIAGGEAERILPRQCLVFGGEAVPPALLATVRRLAPGLAVYNHYGPTEATVGALMMEIAAEADGRAVGLGGPLPGYSVAIVDRQGRPVRDGCVGELLIGGPALAAGYVGQPELTAERFEVRDLPGTGSRRWYRTSDAFVRRADGALLYCGRMDEQLKIRGFRVDLAAVRHMALALGAAQAAVLPIGGEAATGLALFYVAQGGAPAASELRARLAGRLPAYMVPELIREIAFLPVTANGKTDVRALQDLLHPVQTALPDDGSVTAQLSRLWCDILRREQVGADENFFELGGHSFLAAMLIDRIERTCGHRILLQDLLANPTVAGLARLIEGAATGAPPALPVLTPAPEQRHQPFPLTDIQQAYWIGSRKALSLGEVATGSYTEIDMAGLDVARFEQAFNALIARHDMLRVVLLADGGQHVLPETPPFTVCVRDLRDCGADERQAQLAATRGEMIAADIDLYRWPLFDVRLSLLEEGKVRVHLLRHSMVVDAWSVMILTRDFDACYHGRGDSLPALGLAFRDYVLALQGLKQSALYHESRRYWRERIATLPSRPSLPLARDPGAIGQPSFVTRKVVLPRPQWDRIKEIAASLQLSASNVLLRSYTDVLARWSGDDRFMINLTLFNRLPLHPGINDVVGDFTTVNLLEVETDLSLGFAERARNLQARLWQDLDHKYFNGVEVIRELVVARGNVEEALMPVVFTSTLGIEGGRSRGEEKYTLTRTSQVWLDHSVTEVDGDLHLIWSYVDGLFADGVADQMFDCHVRQLRQLQEDAASWQARRLGGLPAGQLAVRASVNATQAGGTHQLIYSGYLASVDKHGERVALVCGERRFTYRELHRHVCALSVKLAAAGVASNRLVAIHMDKGWRQVVAALAITIAGAAYLPLDRQLPMARKRQLLDSAQVRVMVSDQPPGADFSDLHVLQLDADPDWVPLYRAAIAPDNIAYVIFTSGSTGVPKGVVMQHGAVCNTLDDINQRFSVSESDAVLGLSSLSFDLSVYDVFGVLGQGGRLVLPEPAALKDPARWLQLIGQEQITLWNTVPALMQILLTYCEGTGRRIDPSLRLCMMSGDWISVAMTRQLAVHYPYLQQISLGGATEAAIWSIYYPIAEFEKQAHLGSVPYGRPLGNQQWHVLDAVLDDSPDWVAGDLYIGGQGLAQGYWEDPVKTAASFIFSPRHGQVLYKTGDIGRYLPDGNIQFMGRRDSQVKVRGHRIELEEIEYQLGRHDRVAQCKAAVLHDERGQPHLVAYWLANGADADDAPEPALREYLSAALPEYMVPSRFQRVEAIPLTANGKVDVARLPALRLDADPAEHLALDDVHVREVHDLCCELLGRGQIGAMDNLFQLGADSLMITQMLVRMRQRFGVEVPIAHLFARPNIVAIASELTAVLCRQGNPADTGSADREVMEF
ncbi:amino acid adenylation domain-containing protein [Duganella sp. FT92W]|uniref:Amino acid adenylation domain-containing protein n=1 Tax=Pseudoduganella rivuli TaxID=2666085 RepID=A0A7X2LS75_9BURK|nr:non-ribosomal peptide synthetase [Pseudoduganella rivuli]MRV71986.1 amino acid adenylation domain-containing protein [Pseudoduganella rivuli]